MNYPVVLISLLCFSRLATAQVELAPQAMLLKTGNYVVVAAYKKNQEAYAQRYSKKLSETGVRSSYGYDEGRNLIYVYLESYDDFAKSVESMLKMRAQGAFADAWVRVFKASLTQEAQPHQAEQPVATRAPDSTPTPAFIEVHEPAPVEPSKEEPKITTVETEVIENAIPAPIFRPLTLKTTPVFLSLFNPANGKVVEADVEVIDTDLSRLITKVKGNSYLQLPDPKSKTGRLTLVANAFGYRKVQHVVNYVNTEADTLLPYVDMVGNFYMIKFDMVRYHPGDIVTLYNVYFYNDAAIMLPESKYELNSLLQMMKDNPGYRIKLHGHTNGAHRGKIVTMGPSKDFFTVTTDAVQSVSSAKELSGARASVIREWLISQGIAESRIEVKAWGGDRMIHDKKSQHARKNVRVEVEVLDE